MAQVVANAPYTLESSTNLSRPDFKTFLEPDTNVGETNITQFKNNKSFNELHIPNATGPLDYRVTCCEDNVAIRAPMPTVTKKRTEFRILDPCSGFISPAGEVYLKREKTHLGTFGKSKIEPQTSIPQNFHSIRTRHEAIDELKSEFFCQIFILLNIYCLRRKSEGQGEPELNWNASKISDIVIRSRLGGEKKILKFKKFKFFFL